MELKPSPPERKTVKNLLVYHVAPDANSDRWAIIREGKRSPRARGLSKKQAVKRVRRILERKHRPGYLLIHKTRYIIEQQLLVDPA